MFDEYQEDYHKKIKKEEAKEKSKQDMNKYWKQELDNQLWHKQVK